MKKRGFFARLEERRAEKEAREREERAREEERLRRERARERRRAVWRFFFAAPERRLDDEPPEEKSPARPTSRHRLIKLLALLLATLLAAAGLLYLMPVGLLGSHNAAQFRAEGGLPSGYTHILLLGVDRDSSGTSRTDTMMVLSVGKGGLCLTSLMRDTGVSIPGRSGTHRLNAAYAYGGAELAVQTVNQAFGLDITRYALVDYDTFPALIDMLGGVTLSISDAEAQQITVNMREIYYRQYTSGQTSYEAARSAFISQILTSGGEDLHLSGAQALGYARIRNLDSDYGRTNRQRKVLSALTGKLKGYLYRPVTLARFAAKALALVDTNMSTLEILSLGEKALLSGGLREFRLPVNGTYTDSGSMFYDVDYAANHDAFVNFVYGK